jgi:hypothetical protein
MLVFSRARAGFYWNEPVGKESIPSFREPPKGSPGRKSISPPTAALASLVAGAVFVLPPIRRAASLTLAIAGCFGFLTFVESEDRPALPVRPRVSKQSLPAPSCKFARRRWPTPGRDTSPLAALGRELIIFPRVWRASEHAQSVYEHGLEPAPRTQQGRRATSYLRSLAAMTDFLEQKFHLVRLPGRRGSLKEAS